MGICHQVLEWEAVVRYRVEFAEQVWGVWGYWRVQYAFTILHGTCYVTQQPALGQLCRQKVNPILRATPSLSRQQQSARTTSPLECSLALRARSSQSLILISWQAQWWTPLSPTRRSSSCPGGPPTSSCLRWSYSPRHALLSFSIFWFKKSLSTVQSLICSASPSSFPSCLVSSAIIHMQDLRQNIWKHLNICFSASAPVSSHDEALISLWRKLFNGSGLHPPHPSNSFKG